LLAVYSSLGLCTPIGCWLESWADFALSF